MKKKHFWQHYVAEFIGTFFMIFFGCGAVILSQISPESLRDFVVPLVFGGAVSIMIYATGHISGAHFTPAVTIAFWSVGRFPLYRVPGYLASQFAGALSASLMHKFIWSNAHNFGLTSLGVSLGPAMLVEFIISFALMFVIIAVATDSRAVGELAGIAIGVTITVCAFVGGPLTGASMNPARSLAPSVLSANYSNIWIYLLIPIFGAITAAFVYEKLRCDVEEPLDDKHGCC